MQVNSTRKLYYKINENCNNNEEKEKTGDKIVTITSINCIQRKRKLHRRGPLGNDKATLTNHACVMGL